MLTSPSGGIASSSSMTFRRRSESAAKPAASPRGPPQCVHMPASSLSASMSRNATSDVRRSPLLIALRNSLIITAPNKHSCGEWYESPYAQK